MEQNHFFTFQYKFNILFFKLNALGLKSNNVQTFYAFYII